MSLATSGRARWVVALLTAGTARALGPGQASGSSALRSFSSGRRRWRLGRRFVCSVALATLTLGLTAPLPAYGSTAGPGLFGGAFISGEFQPITGTQLWATSGGRVWRSDDGGGRWSDITPPHFSGLIGFTSFGSDDLWFGLVNGPEATVDHSRDGGRSWASSRLGGCGHPTCELMSLSFATPELGWALLSQGSNTNGRLFRTTDGGRSWRPLPAVPFGNAINFVGTSTGWATSAGTGNAALYKTADGGRSWRGVKLPLVADARPGWLGRPHFFSVSSGLVPALLADGSLAVYVTHNGGGSWQVEVDGKAKVEGAAMAWVNPPSFYVASAHVWSARAGLALSMTDDAGRTWERVPSPPLYAGSPPISGFAMASATFGWLDAFTQRCVPGSPARPCGTGPILSRTTDAGRTWEALRAPAGGTGS